MSKIVFAKYNRDRKKEFQISTIIYENDGTYYAKKTPITKEATQQIANMQKSYGKLIEVLKNIDLLKGRLDDGSIVFDFVEGKSITDVLLKDVLENEKGVFLKHLREAVDYIFQTECPLRKFEKGSQFIQVFGDVDVEGESLPITNVDLIFDNIVEKGEKWICLDYEWVFEFSLPLDYVKYRSLHYLYSRNMSHFQGEISEKEILLECGLRERDIAAFAKMEKNFQQWVFGDENYPLKYIKKTKDEVLQKYSFLAERVELLQQEQEERNTHIKYLDGEIQKRDGEIFRKNDEIEVLRINLAEKDTVIRENEIRIKELIDMNVLKDQHIENFRRGYIKWMKLTAPYHFVKRKIKGVIRRGREFRKNFKHEKLRFSNCKNPKVSIIIPVYNQFDYTWNCLKSIFNNTNDTSYEIIVGDDLSQDRTKNLGRYVSGIKVIRNKENLKFLKNCNYAAKQARGEYVLFLNNDTQVIKGWLSSLVELIESDEQIGMVGSKLIYPDGKLQEAGGIIWNDASGWNYGRNDDAEKPEYNYVRETDYISGASIMIRRKLWDDIGGFDELFAPAYCEDSDLAFEVRKRGYKVMYQPKSVVIHFEGVSNGTDTASGLKKYQVDNGVKFKQKWSGVLSQHYDNSVNLFCARERNFEKKVILIVDHYVPTFDKDAGSKTTFQYIKMFLKKGYIVKFIGDNFAQMEPYTSILQQMGVEVLYGAWYAEHIFQWIEENQQYITIAYLNRPHITEKYIHFFAAKTNIKIIYYGHDLCFLREKREAHLTGDKELLKSSELWKKKELGIMREAQMSYYPSEVEINAIHDLDPNIPVKAITAYVFDKFKKGFCYNPKKREGILFVGGFSHGPNIDAVNWFVKEIYPQIRQQEEISFYIVGSNAPKEIQELECDGVVYKGFLTEEELAEMYQNTKVVIVPLRYGAGVKGKVIEAFYQGVPVITTNVGAEGIPDIERVAVIKDDAIDLASELLALYHDNDRLTKMAEKSQAYIKEKFSMDAVWKVIEEDFV